MPAATALSTKSSTNLERTLVAIQSSRTWAADHHDEARVPSLPSAPCGSVLEDRYPWPPSAHIYAGGGQRELTSAGSNQFVWGRNEQYGQPWLQSFNTGGQSQVFVERDSSGTPLGLHNAGNDFYLVLDNLGSVVAVVSTSGTVVARYTYDPYGNAISVDESRLSQPNIIRYTGGALDQTTGLTKLGQRYYDPATGAFTQQDANQLLANPQNGNLYAYAGDSPASYIDPTGAFSFPDFLGTIGIYAAGGAGIGTVAGCVGAGVPTAVVGTILGPEGTVLGGVAGSASGAPVGALAGGIVGSFVGLGVAIYNAF